MLWPFKSASEKLSPEEKKLKEARSYLTWMPYLCPAAFAWLMIEIYYVVRHPSKASVLDLYSPLGLFLVCLSCWHNAKAFSANTRCTWTLPAFLLSYIAFTIARWGAHAYQLMDKTLIAVVWIFGLPIIGFFAWALISSILSDRKFNRKTMAQAVAPAEQSFVS